VADLVSWRVIERGWSVVDAEGNEIGKIDKIVGDVDDDIFDGLAVGDGGTVLTRARYVPCERVAEIREGLVMLDLRPGEATQLEPYLDPVVRPLSELADEQPTPANEPSGGIGELLRVLFGRRP
jgi:uncharacterized protein YrrD